MERQAQLMPLWTRTWEDSDRTVDDAKALVDTIEESALYQPGGLATTTRKSHEQWDIPNTWAPLADVVVDGLNALQNSFPNCGAGNIALEISLRSLKVMYQGWDKDNEIHSKLMVLAARAVSMSRKLDLVGAKVCR